MSAVLITGANGFVGQALCKRMVSNGWHVQGTLRSAEQAALFSARVEVVLIESISADTDWSDALAGVNIVVHLAARVHVMNDTAADPLAAFREVNVAGTERLARMAAKAGVRCFIYLSSIKVNGEKTGLRAKGLGQKEKKERLSFSDMDVPNPEDPYGISKWEAEQVLHKIAAETGMEVVIIRPPLVYGPGVKANFLQMLKVVNRGFPLPLASIKNQRSLIYLGNLVDAIVTCINHPKAAGQTYFVSDGEDVSTPELIRLVAAALGKPARLFPFPLALMKFAGRITGKSEAVDRLLGSLVVDSSKIRRELGWKPPYTMEQGLKETAKWFKRQL